MNNIEWQCKIEMVRSFECDSHVLRVIVKDGHGSIANSVRITPSALDDVAILKGLMGHLADDLIRYLANDKKRYQDPLVTIVESMAERRKKDEDACRRGYKPPFDNGGDGV